MLLVVHCIDRPSPELSWYKDGIIVEENERISFNQQSRILRVTGIEQSDEGVYTCRAAQADPLPTVVSEPASIVVKGMHTHSHTQEPHMQMMVCVSHRL